LSSTFSFPLYVHLTHLHSFPTRRSSDLARANRQFLERVPRRTHPRLKVVAVPVAQGARRVDDGPRQARNGIDRGGVELTHLAVLDRKSTRLNSSHSQISYAVFCLKKKKK